LTHVMLTSRAIVLVRSFIIRYENSSESDVAVVQMCDGVLSVWPQIVPASEYMKMRYDINITRKHVDNVLPFTSSVCGLVFYLFFVFLRHRYLLRALSDDRKSESSDKHWTSCSWCI
jgi:hypothetical protein